MFILKKLYSYFKDSYPDEHSQEIARIVNGSLRRRKNYLTIVKPKSLFLDLLWCSTQMEQQLCSYCYLQAVL